MQAQDATTVFFLKAWTWAEANAKRVAIGAAFAAIAVFVISFYSWRQDQREIEAGNALTQAVVFGNGGQVGDACLKIAADYSGTRAGQRAQLQGATLLFEEGRYADAQAQFQKFLDAYPDNSFAPQAEFGVAASLDAQGKLDLAAGAYQRAAGQSSDSGVAAAAKFALAQIDEQQGKFSDAQSLYEEIARIFPNSSLASEAGLRSVELKMKPPAASTPSSAAPFSLSH